MFCWIFSLLFDGSNCVQTLVYMTRNTIIEYFLLVFETGFLCVFEGCSGTSSCRPGWPQTHRDSPASASQVLVLTVCATTPITQLLNKLNSRYRERSYCHKREEPDKNKMDQY